MVEFNAPLKEHNWTHKLCIDMHTVSFPKNGGCTLKISERHNFIYGSLFGILKS